MIEYKPGMEIPNVLIDVRFRDGEEWFDQEPEGLWWDHEKNSWDIVAYKVSDGKPF